MADTAYCRHCGKDLSTVEEIHAAEGMLFCSDLCAIDYHTELIIMSAKEQAKEWYSKYAETVTPSDIGLTPSDAAEEPETKCEWCEIEMEEDMLTRTDLGMLCDHCIAAIRSRGERIIIFEGGY